MAEMNRRQFVQATVALACAACCTCEALAEGAGTSSKVIDCGSVSDFAKDGITDKWVLKDRFFIVRNEGKLYAPTAICSHKGSTLKLREGTIFCAKHGSKFDENGEPTKGPAKLSLYRYKITKDDKGHVIVDKSKQFDERDWDNDEAAINL